MRNLLDRVKWYGLALLALGVATAIAPAASAQGAQEDPPTRVARLSYVRGDVSFQPAGEEDWGWAVVNRPLTIGDGLWTENNSRAELHVGSTSIRMGEESDLSFLNLDDDVVQLQLNSGTVSVNVRHLYRNETLEVDTPNLAVLLLRPGNYRIDADPNGDFTSVTVRDGQGQVIGGGDSFYVDSGSQVEAEGTERRLNFKVYDLPAQDEFDRWAESRDRRLERSDAARYVSLDLTGYEDLDGNGSWRMDRRYGPVWSPSGVDPSWAPFREGSWAWIDPWGWTWIDDAEWGFVTSHYGRWMRLGRGDRFYWAWVPPSSDHHGGPRPYYADTRSQSAVYCPANVTFLASPGENRIAWFPLAPGEVYVPGFRASVTYVNQLNITNTRVEINIVRNVVSAPERVRYANRVPEAVVAVPRTVFVGAQPVSRANVRVTQEVIVRSPIVRAAPVAPERASVIADQKVRARVTAVAPKPPTQVATRQVVVKATPAPRRVSFVRKQRALEQDPGKPVDRQTERGLANAAAPPPPVVKAPAAEAPPKAAASIPRNPQPAERRAMRRARDLSPRAEGETPATKPGVPTQQPDRNAQGQQDQDRQARDEAARRDQATQQPQGDPQAQRRAEADKRRIADEEARKQRTDQELQTREQQRAAQQQAADKVRADQDAQRRAEADKQRTDQEVQTREQQRAAQQQAADKARADQDLKAREARAAEQQAAEKARTDEEAKRRADAEKRRADRGRGRQDQNPPPSDSANAPAPPANDAAAGRPRRDQASSPGGAPMHVAESEQSAKLVSQPKVEAPENARGARGTVVVRAHIGADGKVKDASVVRGPKPLQGAALANARGRVYRPTVVDGRAVEVETEITVTF